MTNGEKYKNAKERIEAFDNYCNTHNCEECLFVKGCEGHLSAFRWLDLKAEDEKPLPCPFCGGECKTIELFLERDHYVICDKCRYASARGLTEAEAIAAHNRVARKCMGSEVENG